MTRKIKSIHAYEILDSRGNPAIKINIQLENGIQASSSVPSGASTGKHEAVELRDHDKKRYNGMGVLKAISSINSFIAERIEGHNPVEHQSYLDHRLLWLDGTENKSKLGANALVGVSQAIACVAAKACDIPLYNYLGGSNANRLPMPMINVLNGGIHADNNLVFQEFMIVPIGAPTFSEALRYSVETFNCLRQILKKQGYSTNVGDEGGFAPQLKTNKEALDLILKAIETAGFKPGIDIAMALDPAANSFYREGQYDLSQSNEGLKSSSDLIAFYELCIRDYPVVSIEDGLAESDWQGFQDLTASIGHRIQIVGDDILVTNPKIIKRAIHEKTCNAALIKPNQIGTVTETIEAINLCKKAAWNFIISHRSGETNDTFIADLAVAMGGGQIKAGSVSRGERVAKYNRLLEIERNLREEAVFENPFKLK